MVRPRTTSLRPLSATSVLRLRDRGAHILDTRNPRQFAATHLRNALNVHVRLHGTAATALVDRVMPIVAITRPGTERGDAEQLLSLGMDNVLGYLDGGMDALAPYPNETSQIDRIQPHDLRARLVHDDPPIVLDARSSAEAAQASLPDRLHVPVEELRRAGRTLDRHRSYVAISNHGFRSSTTASYLLRLGFPDVTDVDGGCVAWMISNNLPRHGES